MSITFAEQLANFRTNLRARRETQGLSQSDLAQAVTGRGLTMVQPTVHRIESGSRAVRLEEAAAFASVLGQQLNDMLEPADSVDVAAEDESFGEFVGLDSRGERDVDGLPGVGQLLHRFDELFVEVGTLATRVDEVHRAVRGEEVVTLDVDRVASDVERHAKATEIVLEAIEQGVVERTDLLCTPRDDLGIGIGVPEDDASLLNHDSSLTGHGANLDNAPTATTEAATSVVGDIVRDGSDISPGSLTPVEESTATGAAAPSQRPHHHELMFIDEVAERLNRTPASLRSMIYEGKAPKSAKIGKRRMFRRADVEAWIENQFGETTL